jgi:hypothetical protein
MINERYIEFDKVMEIMEIIKSFPDVWSFINILYFAYEDDWTKETILEEKIEEISNLWKIKKQKAT